MCSLLNLNSVTKVLSPSPATQSPKRVMAPHPLGRYAQKRQTLTFIHKTWSSAVFHNPQKMKGIF